MQEDAFEIDQGNLEDDFIPYCYTNRADHKTTKMTVVKLINTDEILRVPWGA
jgi:hypothetical protein